MEIKAIETEYNGYKFRSRLEARWAVFFDSLKIKYEYEEEGFELDDGTRYLPDFHLPDLNMYVEVKGDPDKGEDDIQKSIRFVGPNSKIQRLLILSSVPTDDDINCHPVYEYVPSMDEYGFVWGFFRTLYVNKQPEETLLRILPMELFGLPSETVTTEKFTDLLYKFGWFKGSKKADVIEAIYKKYRGYIEPAIDTAYARARSARFEFGKVQFLDAQPKKTRTVKKKEELTQEDKKVLNDLGEEIAIKKVLMEHADEIVKKADEIVKKLNPDPDPGPVMEVRESDQYKRLTAEILKSLEINFDTSNEAGEVFFKAVKIRNPMVYYLFKDAKVNKAGSFLIIEFSDQEQTKCMMTASNLNLGVLVRIAKEAFPDRLSEIVITLNNNIVKGARIL